MLDVQWWCSLYSAYWQQCIAVALCCLPASSELSQPVSEQLLFLIVVVVVGLVGPTMLHCYWWVPDLVQVLSLCGIVVGIVVVHCVLQLLDCCQWIVHQQLLEGNVVVILVVHPVVALTIVPN